MTLQAIVSKLLEWQIFKPSQQVGQAFYSALHQARHIDRAVQRFFTGMTYPEMMAFITKLMLENFPAGGRVKKFGDEENTFYFCGVRSFGRNGVPSFGDGGKDPEEINQKLDRKRFFLVKFIRLRRKTYPNLISKQSLVLN